MHNGFMAEQNAASTTGVKPSPRTPDFSPYLDFDRAQWRELRNSMPQVLTQKEVIELRGIGENIDLAEVAEVYLPLSRLIHLQVAARQQLTAATETFLGTSPSI